MKKLLFTLAALITAMTMSAQLSFVKSPVALPSNTQDFTLRSSQNFLGLYSHDYINPEIQFGFQGGVAEGTQCAVAIALWPEKLADFQGGKITAFKLGFTKPVKVNGVFVATCKVDNWGEFYDISEFTQWDCDVDADLGWNIINVPTPYTINTDENTHLLIGYYMIQPSQEDDGNYCMGVSDMISDEEMHDYSLWLYTGDYWHQQYFSQEYNYYLSVQCLVEMDDDIDPTQQCQAPDGSYTITGLEKATITLNNNEPDATVYYQIYCDGVFIGEDEFTGDSYSFDVQGVGTYQVTAVAKKEGYKDSTPGGFFFTIHENEAPEPTPTPAPAITWEINDDAVIITATGEGEVLLYVNGELVENPCTIERGEEDVTIVVTATAQAEGMLISDVATETIVIPAKEVVTPPDPEDHNVGYWLVIFDKEGNEMWFKLENANPEDPSGYQTNVALRYSIFGGNPSMSDDERPNVPFYFMVDGVRYGALEENMIPVYGDANQNPLNENENMWNIPVGRNYVIGIVIDPETGKMYMQISRGTYTELDELMGGKTIAGVRYFNAAGQEMQEANGLTIMIITYTDGTTIATKVIK